MHLGQRFQGGAKRLQLRVLREDRAQRALDEPFDRKRRPEAAVGRQDFCGDSAEGTTRR